MSGRARARVLLVDNRDSFTYNLVQALLVLGAEVFVRECDAIDPSSARALRPSHLVVSPGPGRPEQAGAMPDVLGALLGDVPVLGVCLGLQAIALRLGGRLVQARSLVHGKSSPVRHDGKTVFSDLPNPLVAGRYHSLAIEETSLPADLVVSARTEDGEIMAVRHRRLPVEGVQFHPESVLTPDGPALLANFLRGA